MRFQCNKCKTILERLDSASGCTTHCDHCDVELTVPLPSELPGPIKPIVAIVSVLIGIVFGTIIAPGVTGFIAGVLFGLAGASLIVAIALNPEKTSLWWWNVTSAVVVLICLVVGLVAASGEMFLATIVGLGLAFVLPLAVIVPITGLQQNRKKTAIFLFGVWLLQAAGGGVQLSFVFLPRTDQEGRNRRAILSEPAQNLTTIGVPAQPVTVLKDKTVQTLFKPPVLESTAKTAPPPPPPPPARVEPRPSSTITKSASNHGIASAPKNQVLNRKGTLCLQMLNLWGQGKNLELLIDDNLVTGAFNEFDTPSWLPPSPGGFRSEIKVPVSAGEHRIEIRKNGFTVFSGPIDVKAHSEGITYLQINQTTTANVVIASAIPPRSNELISVRVNGSKIQDWPALANNVQLAVEPGSRVITVTQLTAGGHSIVRQFAATTFLPGKSYLLHVQKGMVTLNEPVQEKSKEPVLKVGKAEALERGATAGDTVKPLNLAKLNTADDEEDPCPTPDGNGLLYASKAKGSYDIYTAKKVMGVFQAGKPFIYDKVANERSPFMFKDKYFFATDEVPDEKFIKGKNFDIKMQVGFQRPEYVGGDINTKADEMYPWITPGGKELYFSRKTDEGWTLFVANGPVPGPIGKSKAVGFPPGFHRASVAGKDGLTMYLQGPLDKDRLGIFRSKRAKVSEEWSKPEPVTALNHPDSTKGDMQPALSFDGTRLYFVSDRPGGKGGLDIWMVPTVQLK
jgi:hypothetical protein